MDLELASALAQFVPVILWKPAARFPLITSNDPETEATHTETGLRIRSLPLPRGYARLPRPALDRVGAHIAARLVRQTPEPARSVLVCTTPFFAAVAEQWQGKVVYWLSDLIALYRSAASAKVRRLDRRMCRAATLVCPNSERIAEYLLGSAGCTPERCHVLPNATGSRSLLEIPLSAALPLPEPCAELPRPVAGVIGNLAENTDWLFLEQVIAETPWLSWIFVGPAHQAIRDRRHRRARSWVMHHRRTCFVGPRPYAELSRFARGVDVAVLPYSRREPTYSGSSTRFYDHLAAGHPILATDNVESLRQQTPLLTLVHSAEQAINVLEQLRSCGFEDGLRQARWQASRQNTWEDRARSLLSLVSSG